MKYRSRKHCDSKEDSVFLFKKAIMKCLKITLVLFSIFILISCTATPNVHVKGENTQMNITQSAPVVVKISLSPDGKYILVGGLKGGGSLWDISKGAMVNKYTAELTTDKIGMSELGSVSSAFTMDGKYVLLGGRELKLWDLAAGKPIRTIGQDDAYRVVISSNGKRVLAVGSKGWVNDRKMRLHDINTGRKIAEWNIRGLSSVALSPDGRYALSGHGEGGKIILWDAETGTAIKEFKASDKGIFMMNKVFSVAFSPDGKQALSGGMDGTIRIWDLTSGGENLRWTGSTSFGGVMSVAFSTDGKYILSCAADGFVKLWDASSGSLARTYRFSSGGFTASAISAFFSPDDKYIISVGADASIRIFDVASGEEIIMITEFEDGEWLAITSDGYYNSSEKGAQYLKIRFEEKEYTVNQFYDVFYRPDIVAAKLGGRDIRELTSITMKEASNFPPPAIEFTPISAADQPKVKVCYKVQSTGGGIGEIRLFHNGKLIESDGYYREVTKTNATGNIQLAAINSKAIYDEMRSVAVKGRIDSALVSGKPKGDVFEECKEIDAVPGENEISIAAFNSGNTVQSSLQTTNFTSKLKSAEPHLYILAVGIDQYKDKSVNLKYAVKDAQDMENKLKTQAATIYKPGNIHWILLTDRDATKTNITDHINELTKKIKPNDSFILFVAGHGVLLQNQYYLLTHDYEGNVSENNMISSNEIVEMSKKIKSLSQLFIFDTCHAGGVDTIVSGLYDARMSVLAKKMGLHIYASASDKQAAMDGYKGNGLFTHALLDGLNNNKEADKNKDGKVSIVGLGEYSRKMTANISKQIGHEQTPLIINFGKDSPLYKVQ
ncbi:MAG: WD domain, G-beta repeat [Smithella sp. PtaU1.Bin162]|nr:MAG: WD domain, G-beta repeat [Smithella sp. PtaU1.Bin162]